MSTSLPRYQLSAPSTSANLGPGFDCLGIALAERNLWEVTLVKGEHPGRCRLVEFKGGGALEEIPVDERHLFFSSWKKLHELGLGPDLFAWLREQGLEVELRAQNATPISRGLGSSAAVRVASAEVYRRLLGLERPAWELGSQLEGHPDNAAPAGLGGLVLGTRDEKGRFQVVRPPLHDCWALAVAVPNFALSTEKARAALATELSRADAIFNLGRLGFLLDGLRTGDQEALRLGCQDRLHQNQRATLVPGLVEVMEAARGAGSPAAFLSGAGPTVAAFVDLRQGEESAGKVARAMEEAFSAHGAQASCEIRRVDKVGLDVMEVCPAGC